MYPNHYAVPDGLNISLIGTVRWKADSVGHHVVTLWRDPAGNAYYCHDVWNPFCDPFWDTTRLSDLVEVTPSEFHEMTWDLCQTLDTLAERASVEDRFEELIYLWGYADGMDLHLLDKKAEGRA